ncbi:MAG: beta-glucosidase [Clostridiales bacterium]|nr:beta-glucosidase [Clostridiales bacterium]
MFPKDFVWGCASSAYQIEGAAYENGKGLSVWDEFCRQEGRIFEGHSGDVACDHYHRFRQDIQIMREMGIKAYRFSISWTRVLPDGTGRIEPKGMEFYNALVDELLANGIEPYVTIFCWDYPAALQRRGGWLNPKSPEWFEDYVRAVLGGFGGKVKNYMTINEPEMIFGNSFWQTNNAPGIKMPERDIVRMIHNLLIAHGKAVKLIRKMCPEAKVGVVLCSDPVVPTGESPIEIESAKKFYFRGGDTPDEVFMGLAWYADPMVHGTYPADALQKYEKYLPLSWCEDMKTICQPLDYMGQNIYTGVRVAVNEKTGKSEALKNPVGFAHNALGWTIIPECLYWGARFLSDYYNLPVVITENGMACHDCVSLDGKVHDSNRTDYINRHLLGLKRAVEENIPIKGYFYWSLLDSFEWSSGYSQRFGLVYVDYQTQKRIRKDSSYRYQKVIETNGEIL